MLKLERLGSFNLLSLLGVLLLVAELPGPRAVEAGHPADPAALDWHVDMPVVFKNSYPQAAPVVRIVYRSNPDSPTFGEVYVMGTDGTGQTRLTNNPAFDDNPSWSPNQQQIVFQSSRSGNNEIYRMNADGSGVTNLTNNSSDDSYPTWAPDGTHIAFATNRDGNLEIYVMNSDGSGAIRLTTNTRQDSQPRWSPDGTKLAFVGAGDIYVMPAAGGSSTNLTNTAANQNNSPTWSLDGTRLAYSAKQPPNSNWDILVLNLNAPADPPANLTNTADLSELDPNWSPDGLKIAFSAKPDASTQNEIFVMNAADGSNRVRLTTNTVFDGRPDW